MWADNNPTFKVGLIVNQQTLTSGSSSLPLCIARSSFLSNNLKIRSSLANKSPLDQDLVASLGLLSNSLRGLRWLPVFASGLPWISLRWALSLGKVRDDSGSSLVPNRSVKPSCGLMLKDCMCSWTRLSLPSRRRWNTRVPRRRETSPVCPKTDCSIACLSYHIYSFIIK